MALFGKADAGLPWLTQFYQLNLLGVVEFELNREDMEDALPDTILILKSLKENTLPALMVSDNPESGSTLVRNVDQSELKEWLRRVTGKPDVVLPDDAYDYRLGYLSGLHLLLQKMMNILADFTGEELQARFNMEVFPEFNQELSEATAARCVVATDNRVIATTRQMDIYDQVRSQLVADMFDSLKNGDSFLRCEECNSVFVVKAGKEQRFCSHRCAARVGERRRRKMRKKNKTLALA